MGRHHAVPYLAFPAGRVSISHGRILQHDLLPGSSSPPRRYAVFTPRAFDIQYSIFNLSRRFSSLTERLSFPFLQLNPSASLHAEGSVFSCSICSSRAFCCVRYPSLSSSRLRSPIALRHLKHHSTQPARPHSCVPARERDVIHPVPSTIFQLIACNSRV